MTNLSNTQAIILTVAAQRPDGNLLPLPGSLRGGAASKVVAALLARGFACELPIDCIATDTAANAVWRRASRRYDAAFHPQFLPSCRWCAPL